jgi:hypothetical protein
MDLRIIPTIEKLIDCKVYEITISGYDVVVSLFNPNEEDDCIYSIMLFIYKGDNSQNKKLCLDLFNSMLSSDNAYIEGYKINESANNIALKFTTDNWCDYELVLAFTKEREFIISDYQEDVEWFINRDGTNSCVRMLGK